MSEVSNKAVILVSRPKGPISEDNFKIDNLPYPKISNPSKELIVKLLQCSVDPYMRGRMKEGKSYVPPFELNKPIDGYAILQVIEASEQGNETGFKKGDLVTGVVPFQEYGLINVDQTRVFPLHETLTTGKLPLSYGLSALGMPGMTAWVGFNHLAEPKAGETVLVSAAAGAVGSMVGQLAKIKKCHVVGVAGSDDKVKYICEKLGFDHGFNYKTTSYEKGIEKFCPNGIDIYFDNVGGDALDQAIIHLNKFGRITLCGAISEYNRETPSQGPRLSFLLVGKGAKMQGFIVSYYQHLYPQAADEMAKWLLSGELKIDETEHHGIDSVPRAFIGLMEGENIGKMIVKIAPKQ